MAGELGRRRRCPSRTVRGQGREGALTALRGAALLKEKPMSRVVPSR
ncbi:hypothetical protein [Streptomyces sp. NPDC018059]